MLGNIVNAATTTIGNVAKNVLSNVSQVTGGLSAVTNNLAAVKNLAQSGLPNISQSAPSARGNNSTAKSVQSLDEKWDRPQPNKLFDYSVYNYHFTLSVISTGNYNSSAYMNGSLGQIILASAGAAKETELVETLSGRHDYYIENLRVTGITGLNEKTGNSNALNLTWTVIEPYSMGLFFQALQTAAKKQGYKNYADSVMLLTIKFTGHIDPDNLNIESEVSRKYLPLKIRQVEMAVTAKGCTYDIDAYPYNESGFSDTFNQVKHDVKIIVDDEAPKNLEQLLRKSEKSLKHVVNQFMKERKDQNTTTYFDEIDIVFPDETRDDESLNVIGSAKLGFSNYNKGETGFAEDNFVIEDGVYKRGKMKVNTNNGVYTFDQGQLITDIINQAILTSDYPKFALKKENWTAQGQIKWWRIDIKVFFKGTEDPKTGYAPKKVVFRVEEFLIDAQKFSPPNTKNPGLENKWNEVVKEYYYIYTGANLDVLDVQLRFNTGFYKALTADAGKLSEQYAGVGQSTGGSNTEQLGKQKESNPGGPPPDTHNQPTMIRFNKISNSTSNQGGAFQSDDPATLAARQFHDLATTGHDMINLDLRILGDPFYITSSGTGNYRAAFTNKQGVNGDKEMNYENGETYIAVYFRTPIDQNPNDKNPNWDGGYYFGSEESQFQFSGLFRVLKVESMFNAGKFVQELQLIRLPDQDNRNVPEGKLAIAPQPEPGDDYSGPENITVLEEADFAEIGIPDDIPTWEPSQRTEQQKEYADGLGDTVL